jgi:hypothetical protein
MPKLSVSPATVTTEFDIESFIVLIQLWRWWTHWQCSSFPQVVHRGSYSMNAILPFLVVT